MAQLAPDAVAQIYASEIVSGFDIHKPEKLNDLFMRYGGQGVGFFQTLRTLGFEKPVAQDEYSHFEENRIHEVFTANAGVTASGAGEDIEITLSATDLDANNNFYPRLYDVVMFKDERTGYVAEIDLTAPAAPKLTIRPHKEDAVLTVGAGETVIIISGAFSEGSGQPKGAIRSTIEVYNNAQIIKETISATGTEMVNQTWFDVTSDGQSIPAYYYLGQTDIDYRMSLKIDGALLFGERTTNENAIDPDTGRPIKTTQGIVPGMRERGHDFPVAEGALTVEDFDEIDRILDQEGAGGYIMSLMGIKRHQNIENVLFEYLQGTEESFATDVNATELFGGDKAKAVSVNFQSLFKSERKFVFKRMNNLNNPKTYGASGYGMPNYAMMMPLNTKKDPVNKSNLVESIGVRYRALGSYDRRSVVWTVGGAGNGLKVTDKDTRDWYQKSHIGAHHRGVNQMVLVNDIEQAS